MWKDYFAFNKRQRNGIIVLVCLILIMLLWLLISNHIQPARAKIDFSAFKSRVALARSAKTAESKLINLNTARKSTLENNPEIAPYANAILAYRKRLGGFVNKKQLLEVQGMDTAHYRIICNNVNIDGTKVRRIPLNKVSVKKLAKHPYLSRTQAQKIVAYRKRYGPYKQVRDLLTYKIINEDTYKKIAPYLQTK